MMAAHTWHTRVYIYLYVYIDIQIEITEHDSRARRIETLVIYDIVLQGSQLFLRYSAK